MFGAFIEQGRENLDGKNVYVYGMLSELINQSLNFAMNITGKRRYGDARI